VVDGTDGHVDMADSQTTRRQRKDKKGVDLDNLKREVEMVSGIPSNSSFTYSQNLVATHSVFFSLTGLFFGARVSPG